MQSVSASTDSLFKMKCHAQTSSIKQYKSHQLSLNVKWVPLILVLNEHYSVNPLKWIDAAGCEKAVAGKTLLAPKEQWIARGTEEEVNSLTSHRQMKGSNSFTLRGRSSAQEAGVRP